MNKQNIWASDEYHAKYKSSEDVKRSQSIWDNLTQHEVEDRHIEEKYIKQKYQDKNGNWQEKDVTLHYYSWSECWAELKSRYPNADVQFKTFEREGKEHGCMYYLDGSAEVQCTITIDGLSHTMWLAVMDYKNKAIQNPSSVDISNAKMRCMVKCIALFGLGLDIYRGKYTPDAEVQDENKSSE